MSLLNEQIRTSVSRCDNDAPLRAQDPRATPKNNESNHTREPTRSITPRTRSHTGVRRTLWALMPILLASVLWTVLPSPTALKIGPDEDFELAKPLMSVSGYEMYSQVWDDQPPLYTFLVTQALRHLSYSVLWPRAISLCFALILLASVFALLARTQGRLAAALGIALVFASPGFLELSCSAMQEVPALAPVAASLAILFTQAKSRWPVKDATAGLCFAAGLQIKYIGLIYLPLAFLLIWGRNLGSATPLRRRAAAALVFAASLVFGFVAINLLTGSPLLLQLQQSWASHFSNTQSFEYASPADHAFDWLVLIRNWDITAPALVGLWLLLPGAGRFFLRSVNTLLRSPSLQETTPSRGTTNPKPEAARTDLSDVLPALLCCWFFLALVVFSFHRPWWQYYYIHNALPFCLCAAVGISTAWKKLLHTMPRVAPRVETAANSLSRAFLRERLASLRRSIPSVINPAASERWPYPGGALSPKAPPRSTLYKTNRWALVALSAYTLIAAPWMLGRVYLQASAIRNSPKIENSLVLKELDRFKPLTQFVFTDQPIYAFHACIPLPPNLAILSLKRFWTGDMTNARLVTELEQTKPGLILLSNSSRELPYQDLIDQEYRLVYQDNANSLYAHRSIANKAKY